MSTSSILSSVLSSNSSSGSNGFDVTSAVDAILYADRAPERQWQASQAALANQTTAIDQLQTESSTLSDALMNLQNTSGALNSLTATSSNSSIVTATVANGTASGNHTVEVDLLATAASAYSSTVANASAQLSSGSFQITVGTGSPVTVNIGTGDGTADTLTELAATINSKSLGVTATVVTDSSGARLSLVSQATGSAAAFTLSNESGLTFTQPNAGTNASLTVDGIPITSPSNTVTGAISGVTLNLQSASQGTTVNLSLGADTTSIEDAVSSFVSAYNTLINSVNSQFSYDSASGTSGALAADSTVQSFQSDLLASTNYSSGSGSLEDLTSIGVTTNSDGTLSLDSTTLSSAIQSDLSGVQSFFQGTSPTTGFVSSLETSLDTYTDPSQGAFTIDLSSIKAENTDLTSQTTTLEDYLTTLQSTLTAEYNTADEALIELPNELKQINALLSTSTSS